MRKVQGKAGKNHSEHFTNESYSLFQDCSRSYTCEDCGKQVANIWEHSKGKRCPVRAARMQLEAAEKVGRAWTARLEQGAEALDDAAEDAGRVPTTAQLTVDIESAGGLLRAFWRFCVHQTGAAENTANSYTRYVRYSRLKVVKKVLSKYTNSLSIMCPPYGRTAR